MKDALQPIVRAGEAGKFALADDGFVQVFPFGEWDGDVVFGREKPDGVEGVVQADDGRWYLPIVQVLDRAAAEACLASFSPDTLLDYEHLSDQPAGESRAGGWAESAQVRDDGLYLRVRWSADGLGDVTGGNYRYLSPVFPWSEMEPLGGNRFRPRILTKAALTNCPRLRGIRAVSNSERSEDRGQKSAEAPNTPLSPRVGNTGTAPAKAEREKEKKTMREQLIQALGLSAEATDEQIVAAVGDMQKRLKDVEQAQAEAQVENDLKELGDRVENREAVKTALLKDRAGTLLVLNALKKPQPAPAPAKGKEPVALNSAAAKEPVEDETKKKTGIARAAAAFRKKEENS